MFYNSSFLLIIERLIRRLVSLLQNNVIVFNFAVGKKHVRKIHIRTKQLTSLKSSIHVHGIIRMGCSHLTKTFNNCNVLVTQSPSVYGERWAAPVVD